jgi:heme-degrading monooxygenase HmoA
MYVRMTFFKVKPGKMDELRNLYVNEVIPTHKNNKGIRFVHLLEALEAKDEGISVTAWDTRGDLETMFADEPVLKSYEVTASSEPLILRIF